MTAWERIPLDVFDTTLKLSLTEVSSSALGSRVVGCSDDFFASRHNLIKPGPSISMKGQFGPNGALYDGWESRRHNPAYDWVIVLLAPHLSTVAYVDIDTSHFSGNEAPYSQVFGLALDTKTDKISPKHSGWKEILPVVELGPNSRHMFKLDPLAAGGQWNALMVNMIPDGGMARFRAYGQPVPPPLYAALPPPSTEPIDLLSALNSGRIISCSDANFSPPQNLLLPGRGHDMSDGWETRRSQLNRGKYGPGGALEGQERKEWVVVKMGTTGVISYVEVDTAFHPGNYPAGAMVEACLVDGDVPTAETEWTTIVTKKPLGPHRQHYCDVERAVPAGTVFSHVRLSTYPDGGLKRLRAFGYPLAPTASAPASQTTVNALPLTVEAFRPYGSVIQGFSFASSAPKGTHVTVANQGTASKFHRLAMFPDEAVKAGLKVEAIRVESTTDVSAGSSFDLTQLQKSGGRTYIPQGSEGIVSQTHLVVVATSGLDGKPDLSTLKAFLATAAQGVSYAADTWHYTTLVGATQMDFACIAPVATSAELPETHFVETTTVQIPALPVTSIPVKAAAPTSALDTLKSVLPSLPQSLLAATGTPLVPTPITAAAFAPFGHIITASHPAPVPVTTSYPADAGAITGLSVFRATPKVGLERGKVFDIRLMERHAYTSQAFIPMGKGEWVGHGEEALPSGGEFLVVVAANGADDKPDSSTLKAFIMPPSTGLSYNAGVWHHPVLVLDSPLDLACVETQISTGIPEADPRDCELLEYTGAEVFGQVAVPSGPLHLGI